MTTDLFIIGWLLVLLVYELWTLKNCRPNDTISHRVVVACRRWPCLALVILVFTVLLAGHWFIPDGLYWPWAQPVFIND